MKLKTTITVLLAVLSGMAAIHAQSIPEGMNHLYAERYKSAKEIFEKLLATNPNNLDAVYWLGQTDIALEDVKSARDLYSKTLQANGNAPLILAGMGHVNLIDGKKDEARQMFETAINLSSGKKGPDVNILNAIGRANIDAKIGDIAYALDKLKLAAEKDPKNADVFLNLGDAFRKAHDGGQAVINYDLALSINPNLARADYRKAMIYYTQKNWDLFTELMNKALSVDAKFAPVYYELYYYYLLNKHDFNTAQDYANKYVANADQDPQNAYLVAQTCWAKKDYDCAINTAKDIAAKAGTQTQPKVYKLLADSYVNKGDTTTAKQYIDQYFAIVKEEEIVPTDYILKGQIYSAGTGDDNMIVSSYEKAVQLDSDYYDKMDILQKAINNFEAKKKWLDAAELRIIQAQSRKNAVATDPFFIGYRFYLSGNYQRADSFLKVYNDLAPDTVIGHYLRAQANFALDSTMMVEPFASAMIQEYQKTLDLAQSDKVKFKTQAVVSSKLLAGYYNNIKKDRDSAIIYLQKGLEFDPENASIKDLLDYLQKSAKPVKNTKGKPTGSTKPVPSAINSSATNRKAMVIAKA
ncbi:MAG: tetratricopeptide repeat protein [Chitinophagales bacterium]